MRSNGTISLSAAQSRVIQLMQDHGYTLVWNNEHFFWEFQKNGKSVSKNVSSRTAQSLVKNWRNLITWVSGTQILHYALTEEGRNLKLQ